ncbi:MAG: hypothetical protein JW834_01625, partial [Candidatus Diapherotrites archaeon]|nr:hypothetical protein [Candidatus Diapherotrites archaeon]
MLQYTADGMELASSSVPCDNACEVVDEAQLLFTGTIGQWTRSMRINAPEGTDVVIRARIPHNAIFVNAEPQPVQIDGWIQWDSPQAKITYNTTSLFQAELLALGAALTAIGIVWTRWDKLKHSKEVTSSLRGSELEVMEVLRAAGGTMRQTGLERALGWPGPKVSKVLRRLEESEVVKRKPKGRENEVRLLI